MSFWMKNTLIPLDMVMILKNGTISKIFDSVPPLTLDSRRSGFFFNCYLTVLI